MISIEFVYTTTLSLSPPVSAITIEHSHTIIPISEPFQVVIFFVWIRLLISERLMVLPVFIASPPNCSLQTKFTQKSSPMLSVTMSSNPSKRATLSSASLSSRSLKPLSGHSAISPTTDNQHLLHQIAVLKQKAHHSFMQVIQIQELHEEQLEGLRNQFALKQAEHQQQLERLTTKIVQLQHENSTINKNSKRHILPLADELSLQSIEPISCLEESKLDESAILHFAEFTSSQNTEEQLHAAKQEVKTEIRSINGQNPQQLAKVQAMIDKLFEYVIHLRGEFIRLQESSLQIKRECDSEQDNSCKAKKFTESLQKENIFMSTNIKRIAVEKMNVQKKLAETERKVKTLEERLRKWEEQSKKKKVQCSGTNGENIETLEQKDYSLDLNEFIQQNINKVNLQGQKKRGFTLASKK